MQHDVRVNDQSIEDYLKAEHEKQETQEIKNIVTKSPHQLYRKSRLRNQTEKEPPGFLKPYSNQEIMEYSFMNKIGKVQLPKGLSVIIIIAECIFHWDDIKKLLKTVDHYDIKDDTPFSVKSCQNYLDLRFNKDQRLKRENISSTLTKIYRILAGAGLMVRTRDAITGKHGGGKYVYQISPDIRKYTKDQLFGLIMKQAIPEYDLSPIVPEYIPYPKKETQELVYVPIALKPRKKRKDSKDSTTEITRRLPKPATPPGDDLEDMPLDPDDPVENTPYDTGYRPPVDLGRTDAPPLFDTGFTIPEPLRNELNYKQPEPEEQPLIETIPTEAMLHELINRGYTVTIIYKGKKS